MIWLWYLYAFYGTYHIRTCFAQIARPSASRFIRVFQDLGLSEELSVDVSTSNDAVYSGDTLTITTSTSFFTNRMYYLLADSGVHARPCVCIYWQSVKHLIPLCIHLYCTCKLQVLLLLLHYAQSSQMPSHLLPNGHLESLKVRIMCSWPVYIV